MAVPVNVSRFFCILLQNVKNLGKLDGLIALSIRADGEGQLIDTIFANDDVPIGVIRGTGSSGYGIGLRGTGFLCSPVGKLIAFFASIFVGAITRGILGIITVGLALSAVKIIGCGNEVLLILGNEVLLILGNRLRFRFDLFSECCGRQHGKCEYACQGEGCCPGSKGTTVCIHYNSAVTGEFKDLMLHFHLFSISTLGREIWVSPYPYFIIEKSVHEYNKPSNNVG